MAPESPYVEAFGVPGRGMPGGRQRSGAGDPRKTEKARRRAVRVLVDRHQEEFEELFSAECAYLRGRDH